MKLSSSGALKTAEKASKVIFPVVLCKRTRKKGLQAYAGADDEERSELEPLPAGLKAYPRLTHGGSIKSHPQAQKRLKI